MPMLRCQTWLMTDKDLENVFERCYQPDTSGLIPDQGTRGSICLPEQQVAGNNAIELSYQ